ncbi:SufD family Fe-S cluster assembly protein, partial [Staphylococcus aureus]|nr:SufD family Fe-S cluster assembly protein [Staphylococcus aureus]
SSLKSVVVGTGEQKINLTSKIVQYGKETDGYILKHGVMKEHAASVGRVDPDQLYYLMSRGISQREAERLVIHGFLDPVVRELPIEDVKRQLREVIERKVSK